MDRPHRVLLVTSSRNMKRHVNRALVSAGFVVDTCPPVRGTVEQALALSPDMCIIDAGEREDEIRWLVDHLYSTHKEVIALLASQDHETPFVRDSLAGKNLNNLIAKHGGVAATSELIDEAELIVTCQKLLRHDIFGLDKYVTTWGIQLHEMPITGTGSKGEAVGALEDFLDRLDCYAPVKQAATLVADELIMNAIFNAPRDGEGRAKYATLDRATDLVLEPHERAAFCYACDGRHVALSVRDPFGSLDRDLLITYLHSYFSGEPAAPEEKQGGAGLGLYLVLNSITQLTFNVQAGVATEVIALFYVHGGSRGFTHSGRSLNIFYLG